MVVSRGQTTIFAQGRYYGGREGSPAMGARQSDRQSLDHVIVHRVHYIEYFMRAWNLEVVRTSKGPQQSLALNWLMICSVRRRRKMLMTRKVS